MRAGGGRAGGWAQGMQLTAWSGEALLSLLSIDLRIEWVLSGKEF